jgi:hypothetical protein
MAMNPVHTLLSLVLKIILRFLELGLFRSDFLAKILYAFLALKLCFSYKNNLSADNLSIFTMPTFDSLCP